MILKIKYCSGVFVGIYYQSKKWKQKKNESKLPTLRCTVSRNRRVLNVSCRHFMIMNGTYNALISTRHFIIFLREHNSFDTQYISLRANLKVINVFWRNLVWPQFVITFIETFQVGTRHFSYKFPAVFKSFRLKIDKKMVPFNFHLYFIHKTHFTLF